MGPKTPSREGGEATVETKGKAPSSGLGTPGRTATQAVPSTETAWSGGHF